MEVLLIVSIVGGVPAYSVCGKSSVFVLQSVIGVPKRNYTPGFLKNCTR